MKPALRRRSKPLGASVVLVAPAAAAGVPSGETGAGVELGAVEVARAASAASSSAVRVSEMEQWM